MRAIARRRPFPASVYQQVGDRGQQHHRRHRCGADEGEEDQQGPGVEHGAAAVPDERDDGHGGGATIMPSMTFDQMQAKLDSMPERRARSVKAGQRQHERSDGNQDAGGNSRVQDCLVRLVRDPFNHPAGCLDHLWVRSCGGNRRPDPASGESCPGKPATIESACTAADHWRFASARSRAGPCVSAPGGARRGIHQRTRSGAEPVIRGYPTESRVTNRGAVSPSGQGHSRHLSNQFTAPCANDHHGASAPTHAQSP